MISAVHVTNIVSAGSLNGSASIAHLAGHSGASATHATSPFGELMNDALGKAGQLEDQARSAVDGLISGTGVDVHQAMIATEKASMAFEMVLAVRNKAIQSYQSVMAMQF